MTILVNASLSVYLVVGGIVPVQANQAVSHPRQQKALGKIIYLPLVMKTYHTKAISISTGQYDNCTLTEAGGVKCWGYNYYGQLGDGTTTDRLTPVDVVGLRSGVDAISTGYKHTCALTSLGGVKCWGFNSDGQLGDGTKVSSSTPVNVTGLSSGVSAISAGGFHTCALNTSGGVKCWGFNAFGQLGDGTTTSSSTTVNVGGLSSGVSAIRAGANHTCALTQAGGVKCWGDNSFGQLGDGTALNRLTPVNVAGLSSGISAISAGGSHTCALTTGGGLVCWGFNAFGQLGDGTTTSRYLPVSVIGLAGGVSGVSGGPRHTCALMQAGGARCWGYNIYGELGDGTTNNRLSPVNVTGLTDGVSAISAGYLHTCALTQTGGIRCWGDNSFGGLGDGSTLNHLLPVTVFGFP